jgi:hypothetical protein
MNPTLMKRITLSTFALLLLFATGCDRVGIRGNGNIVTDRRAVAEFTEIRAHGAFEIEWRPGPPAISIIADENLLPYIDNQLSGNTLTLKTRDRIWSSRKLKAVVASTTLRGAQLTGACRLDARQIAGPKFFLQSRGAAHIVLVGRVDELLADMTGAAKLDAEALQTRTAELSGSGASNATVFASETVRASISGAGKVIYSGNPKTVERHISGAGSIRAKE